jgi:hypothetical protein
LVWIVPLCAAGAVGMTYGRKAASERSLVREPV